MVRLALLLFCCLPVCAQSYLGTGLPVCYINTEDSLPIASKQNYVNAKITITLNGDTLLRETDVSVRGHGNATWAAYPKKPPRPWRQHTCLCTLLLLLLPQSCDDHLGCSFTEKENELSRGL